LRSICRYANFCSTPCFVSSLKMLSSAPCCVSTLHAFIRIQMQPCVNCERTGPQFKACSSGQVTSQLIPILYTAAVGTAWSLLGSAWNSQAALHNFTNIYITGITFTVSDTMDIYETDWQILMMRARYCPSYHLTCSSPRQQVAFCLQLLQLFFRSLMLYNVKCYNDSSMTWKVGCARYYVIISDLILGRDGSVGIATRYGLDDPRIESR
jgi:hypothetical protein